MLQRHLRSGRASGRGPCLQIAWQRLSGGISGCEGGEWPAACAGLVARPISPAMMSMMAISMNAPALVMTRVSASKSRPAMSSAAEKLRIPVPSASTWRSPGGAFQARSQPMARPPRPSSSELISIQLPSVPTRSCQVAEQGRQHEAALLQVLSTAPMGTLAPAAIMAVKTPAVMATSEMLCSDSVIMMGS